MSKNWSLILIFFLVICLIIFLVIKLTPTESEIISLKIKDQDFRLEIAKTMIQRANGLMNRTDLCPKCGMIFFFDLEIPISFWMKNTPLPLDIIFLNKNGVVVNIAPGVPYSTDNIPSLKPTQYVIELNQGTADKIGLKIGDSINLPW